MKGIRITGVKLTEDGKIERDKEAALKKLPVNKQIAAKEAAKNMVRFKRGGR